MYANREVRARIRRLQVGQGQPKYTLTEILGRPRVSVKPGNRVAAILSFSTKMLRVNTEVTSHTPSVTSVATEQSQRITSCIRDSRSTTLSSPTPARANGGPSADYGNDVKGPEDSADAGTAASR